MSEANKEKNFISAVVYTYNAEKGIQDCLRMINTYLREHFLKYEIICVNDASTDQTTQKIKEFASDSEGEIISILNMSFHQGLEASMDAGVDLAIGDFVYEFDSSLVSYSADLLFKTYMHCLEGFDIVSACPENAGHAMSDQFYGVFNKYSGSQYKLRTESFRILSRRAINRVHSMSKTIPYRKAIYANCGLATDALYYKSPIVIPAASHREKELQMSTAQDALVLYTDIAYRFAMTFSMAMMLVTALVVLYTVFIYINNKPVAGWTTTMLFLSFGFFGISVMLTILIKYASLILRTVFTKQKYVVESIEKLK